MDVVYARCAGIDISKTDVKVCLRVPGPSGRRHSQVRTFSTMADDLLAMREWLVAEGVEVVGMEATGAYWKPVYYVLEDVVEAWLLNARHMRNVPGRKTDVADSEWIAKLVEHGLVRPSFVPPAPIRQLRDLTRYRAEITAERTREAQRLEKFLEDTGIKLSAVVSDILGKSARSMLEALIGGERDPRVLSELALGSMRGKVPILTRALTGRFTEHHAFLLRTMLRRIDAANAQIAEITGEIERQLAPYRQQARLLATIPGVSLVLAQVLLAEIGADMSRFPTAGHLASWAGMCPGNNESGGTRKSGRTRHGDSWLRAALGQAAMAGARTKNTYLAARYKRLVARRGKKRALVALGHSILIAAWHILTEMTPYQDLGGDYFIERTGKARRARRLVAELHALGYHVDLTSQPLS